ncbi:DUF2213 domain-containing protein [Sphingobium sp. CCH11-B1]|uniref:DUF2213 domain-containing protein n=1 Tax=Sphingobium sp. CCH11-B1 TaxID=1768781 RepID=UPI0008368EE7|nr:DUF2213 domain-containing protein [Sphingobium sp. CCH11-B1]
MVQLTDTLDASTAARICADGSLVAEVFAARTGIQDYLGREVDPDNQHGLRDKATVKVYRPESEVFKADSLATFAYAPVTLDHPSVPVTADNWRQLGRGEINGDVVRDGQRVRVPIIVRDAKAVEAATTTHKQLSMGYATKLVFPTDGRHPDGTLCDAYQTELKINHIALVRAARGGPELRVIDERKPLHLLTDGIGDAKAWLKKAIALHKKHMDGTAPTTGPAGEKSQMLMMEQMENALSALDGESPASRMKMDFNPKELLMKIRIGDAEVDATNGEAVRIANDAREGAFKELQTKVGTLTADLATANTTIQTKDGEIAALNAKLKDAEVTPAKLQALADARADVIGKAKLLAPNIVADGKTDAEIRKEAVSAKLGDAAKDMADAAIEGAFIAFTKDAKIDPLRATIIDGVQTVGDAAAKEQQAFDAANDFNAWRKQA